MAASRVENSMASKWIPLESNPEVSEIRGQRAVGGHGLNEVSSLPLGYEFCMSKRQIQTNIRV
jgi:hypothetical protein